MVKRAYPRKKQELLRIPVTFSLSGEMLERFREAYALAEGHEPTLQECREYARNLAFSAIDTYIKRHIEIEGAVIL
jgi:hypothetical protein